MKRPAFVICALVSLVVGPATTIAPAPAESAAPPIFGAYALEIARVCSFGVGCNPDQEQSQGGIGALSASGEVNISEPSQTIGTARAHADLSSGKLGVYAQASEGAEAIAAATFQDRVFLHVSPTITGGFTVPLQVSVEGSVTGLGLSPDLGPARFGSFLNIALSYHDDSGFYCILGCQHDFPDGDVEIPLHDEVPFVREINIPIRLNPDPLTRITPSFLLTASLNAGGGGRGAGFAGPNTGIGEGVHNAIYDFFNTAAFSLVLPAGVTITSDSGTFLSQGPVVTPPADTTPPTTTASVAPSPNANGWNNTNVVVTLNATDNAGGSGVKEIAFSLNGAQGNAGVVAGGTAAVTISAEGTSVLSFFARDSAGNQEAAQTLTVRIDKASPTLAFGTPSPAPNASGWNNSDVSIPFAASDALSGLDAARSAVTPIVLTTEGTAVTATITVVDKAGNAASFTSPAVKIDKTPPSVVCELVARRRQSDDDDEKGLFRVSAIDTLSQVASITLGDVVLAQGEVIRIHSTKRSGVRLVGDDDDDDRHEPGLRQFKVGAGEAVIRATDFAGNVGTAACPLRTQ